MFEHSQHWSITRVTLNHLGWYIRGQNWYGRPDTVEFRDYGCQSVGKNWIWKFTDLVLAYGTFKVMLKRLSGTGWTEAAENNFRVRCPFVLHELTNEKKGQTVLTLFSCNIFYYPKQATSLSLFSKLLWRTDIWFKTKIGSFWLPRRCLVLTIGYYLTFRWPCIVINSYNKTNQMH